ncbi:HNH endonuclease [Serratia sp. Je.1.23.a]|uniref:HNH endonuclease n=1 Tax=Serratia sp. Je.1.23.a TaxID=3142841 RepID=UPI003DA7B51C
MSDATFIDIPALESEGYEINENGTIYSRKKGRILKGSIRGGYRRYSLCIDGEVIDLSEHRLVATKYIPNPENKKEVNHKDKNRLNNKISNLEWVTTTENIFHSHHGSHKERNLLVKRARELCASGMGQTSIAKLLGVSFSTINLWVKGVGKTKPRYTDEFKMKAINMNSLGLSHTTISQALGVSASMVGRWCNGKYI